jgi:cell wall-associated NlpC family hydrolase
MRPEENVDMTDTPTTTESHRPTQRRRVLALVAFGIITTTAASSLAVPSVGAAPDTPAISVQARSGDPIALLAEQTLASLASSGDEYARLRNQLAEMVATRVGLDPDQMSAAWAAADATHQRALLVALTQLGLAYRRNALRPGVAFDCSGLTSYAWASAGVSIPRSSGRQIRAVARRDASTAQAGDLVYYPGHVMLWLGVDRAVVHASDPSRPIEVRVIKRKSLIFGDPTG